MSSELTTDASRVQQSQSPLPSPALSSTSTSSAEGAFTSSSSTSATTPGFSDASDPLFSPFSEDDDKLVYSNPGDKSPTAATTAAMSQDSTSTTTPTADSAATTTATTDSNEAGLQTLKAGMTALDLQAHATSAAPSAPLDSPGLVPLRPAPPPPIEPAASISTTSALPSPPPPSLPPSRASAPALTTAAASGPLSGMGVRRPPGPGVGLKAGVRGAPTALGGGGMKIPPSLQKKMQAMASRSSSSSQPSSGASTPTTSSVPTTPASTGPPTPQGAPSSSTPLTFRPNAGPPSRLAAGGPAARRRPNGLTLAAMGATSSPAGLSLGSGLKPVGAGGEGDDLSGSRSPRLMGDNGGTPFANFSKIVDPSGRLNFASKAVLHADGVDFSSGASFKIKMDDFELFEELGKGNYGTVQKVWHKPTKVTMALKEIRLELDDSKLKTIITELDILHRATSPYIIDFYGAFFIESCVYYCMEYMDAQSLEKVSGCNVREDVLSTVTRSIVAGLKFLKDELKIMHRDVKPTNVLLNRKGMVKLCDFGVSGQLDRSLAKTNIGCQSYMAPERIKGESQGAPSSYTASSDVWSLGLSIIEFAIGHYPYPPETYSNVFAQLTAIVHGDPPSLPDRYSDLASDFVAKCLEKVANRRPTYGQLMEHPFITQYEGKDVDMVGWVEEAHAYRAANPRPPQMALQ